MSVSPLSSATTLFQTATKGGSGSAVNDEYPLKADPETTKGTMTTVHIVIHRLWRQDSRRRSVVYRREHRGPGLVTVVVQSVGSRLFGHPRFVVCRRFVIESALAEANSFLPECQPFCNILRGLIFAHSRGVTAVANVNRRPLAGDRSGEV